LPSWRIVRLVKHLTKKGGKIGYAAPRKKYTRKGLFIKEEP